MSVVGVGRLFARPFAIELISSSFTMIGTMARVSGGDRDWGVIGRRRRWECGAGFVVGGLIVISAHRKTLVEDAIERVLLECC